MKSKKEPKEVYKVDKKGNRMYGLKIDKKIVWQ
jgi:hypothetical protein